MSDTCLGAADAEQIFGGFVHSQYRRRLCQQSLHGVGVDAVETVY